MDRPNNAGPLIPIHINPILHRILYMHKCHAGRCNDQFTVFSVREIVRQEYVG